MLRISWKDRITNDEVYHRMETGKALMGDIVRRQLSFLGHVLQASLTANEPEADNERPFSLGKMK